MTTNKYLKESRPEWWEDEEEEEEEGRVTPPEARIPDIPEPHPGTHGGTTTALNSDLAAEPEPVAIEETTPVPAPETTQPSDASGVPALDEGWSSVMEEPEFQEVPEVSALSEEEQRQQAFSELEVEKQEHLTEIEEKYGVWGEAQGRSVNEWLAHSSAMADLDRWYSQSKDAIEEGLLWQRDYEIGGQELAELGNTMLQKQYDFYNLFEQKEVGGYVLNPLEEDRSQLAEGDNLTTGGTVTQYRTSVENWETISDAYTAYHEAVQARRLAIGTPDEPGTVTSLLNKYSDDESVQAQLDAMYEEGESLDSLLTQLNTDLGTPEMFKEKIKEEWESRPESMPDNWWERPGWVWEQGDLSFWEKLTGTVATSGPGLWFGHTVAPVLEDVTEAFRPWSASLYGVYTMLPGYQRGEEQYRALSSGMSFWERLKHGANPFNAALDINIGSWSSTDQKTKEMVEIYEDLNTPGEWALEMTHPVWLATFYLAPESLVAKAGLKASPELIKGGSIITKMAAGATWADRMVYAFGTGVKGAGYALKPVSASVAATMWIGKIGKNYVFKLVATALKPVAYPARKLMDIYLHAGVEPGFKELSEIAEAGERYAIKQLSKPEARRYKAQYLITWADDAGRQQGVLAADLAEARNMLVNDTLFAQGERYYVPALKKVFTEKEYKALDVQRAIEEYVAKQQASAAEKGIIRPTMPGFAADDVNALMAGAKGIGESVVRSVNVPDNIPAQWAMDAAAAFNGLKVGSTVLPWRFMPNVNTVEGLMSANLATAGKVLPALADIQVAGGRQPLAPFIRALGGAKQTKREAVLAAVAWAGIREQGQRAVAIGMTRLKFVIGNIKKEFGVTNIKIEGEDMLTAVCTKIKPKAGEVVPEIWHNGKAYHAIGDIMEHPSQYALTWKQEHMIKAAWKYLDEIKEFALANDVKIKELGFAEGDHYFPRFVVGKHGVMESKAPVKNSFKAKQAFEHTRIFDEMAEGIKKGYEYEDDIFKTLEWTGLAVYNKAADNQLAKILTSHGLTKNQIVELMHPGMMARQEHLEGLVKAFHQADGCLTQAIDGRIKGGSIAALDRNFPEIAKELRRIMELRPEKIEKALTALKKDLTKEAKVNLENLKELIRIGQALREPTAKELQTATYSEVKKALKILKAEVKLTKAKAGTYTAKELQQFALDAGLDWRVFKEAIGVVREAKPIVKTVTSKDIDFALRYLKAEQKDIISIETALYTEDALIKKNAYKDSIKALREGLRDRIVPVRAEKATVDQTLAAARESASSLTAYDAQKMFKSVGLAEEQGRRIQEVGALKELIFPESTARALEPILAERGNKVTAAFSSLASGPRMLMTTLDFGYFMIQGLTTMFFQPQAFAESARVSLMSIAKPGVMNDYMAKESTQQVVQELLPYGLMVGTPATEFTEAAFGSLAHYVGKVGIKRGDYGLSLMTPWTAFSRGFENFGTAARIEMGKALLPLARSEIDKKGLAEYLNLATGTLSTKAMGIGRTQREIEGAFLLFSPRYTRASFALMADVTKGGLRGEMARQTLASMMAAGSIMYAGIAYALGQEPNFDPRSGRFLTVEIAGFHMGLGSIWTQMARLLADVIITTKDSPNDWYKLNPMNPDTRKDEPLVHFWSSRLPPTIGTAYDILLGENYIGEPIDSLPDYADTLLVENLLPFWISAQIEAGEMNLAAAGAELGGLRTFPLSNWEHLNNLYDRYALMDYGVSYQQLMESKPADNPSEIWGQQAKEQLLKDHEDLMELQNKVWSEKVIKGDQLDKLMSEYFAERDQAIALRQENWEKVSGEFKKNLDLKLRWMEGDGSLTEEEITLAKTAGKIFREKIQEYDKAYRDVLSHLWNNERYEPCFREWDEQHKGQDYNQYVVDLAYDDYCASVYGGEYEDEYGNFLWEKYDGAIAAFKAKWGMEIYDKVQGYITAKKDEPAIVQEYRKASKMCRPYYTMNEKYEGLYTDMTQEEVDAWEEAKILEILKKDAPSIAVLYQHMQADPAYSNLARQSESWSAISMYINAITSQIRTSSPTTLNQVVDAARYEWRVENPQADLYLRMFYDVDPLDVVEQSLDIPSVGYIQPPRY